MHPKMRVELCITSTNIDADQITSLLELAPTKSWKVGDSILGTTLRKKTNGWCFSVSDYKIQLDMAELARPLLERLMAKSSLIKSVCKDNNLQCELSYAVYITDETPIAHFDQKLISYLENLGASMDIDIILTE